MINLSQLQSETAELLPKREALSRFSFNLHKTTTVTKHTATVHAENNSLAVNDHSRDSLANSEAKQVINISQ
ncbi:hypothetical protein AB0D08_36495 [Kitasatospora sp. NPDC048540]|uniref:hypothetical protein n=1 Tax=unclassified Kitasatospora TaxID=2633591 RepID=UPI00053A5EC2|nr:hypothetical protein [Kitasatospora sp. MBT63]